MLNFGASKPRVKARPPWISTCLPQTLFAGGKKMATEGGRIDFMFRAPTPSHPAAGTATGLNCRNHVIRLIDWLDENFD